jgi:hypothetical protein
MVFVILIVIKVFIKIKLKDSVKNVIKHVNIVMEDIQKIVLNVGQIQQINIYF